MVVLFALWLGDAFSLRLAVATVIAAVLSWAAIPPLGRFLRRHRIVVRSGGRFEHRGSVPEMGGLAVFVPFAVVAILLALRGGTQMLGLLGGSVLLLAVGIYDDLKGASPKLKLAAQILGALVLVATGFRLDTLGVPGIGTFHLGHFGILLTVFWVVLATNAFNLIDGMDGVAAGVAIVTLIGLVSLGVAAALAALMVGALFGFLPYNLPRARIFLGDSGTMFLGFLLAALLLALPPRANVPLAIGLFAYPLGDMTLAILRRFVRAKPLFRGDRSHIHHKLRQHVGSDRTTVLLVWAMAAALALMAIRLRNALALVLILVAWGGMAVLLVLLGRVRLSRMLRSRKPFQELHLTRSYVEGRLRIARSEDEVRAALRRLAEDLHLASVRVGEVFIRCQPDDEPTLRLEHVRLRRGRASWSAAPDAREEEALTRERRAVVHDVLNQADRRLRQIRGDAETT